MFHPTAVKSSQVVGLRDHDDKYFQKFFQSMYYPHLSVFFSIRGIYFDSSFPSLPTYQTQTIIRNTDKNRVELWFQVINDHLQG